MSLELSGTTPAIKGVAGSVSAPAITGDDANTGISFPAADTIKFSTGGVERMAITNSGISGTGVGGKILQYKSANKTNTISSTSTSQVEVSTDLRTTITPIATDSTIVVIANLYTTINTSDAITIRIYRNTASDFSGTTTSLMLPSSAAADDDGNSVTAALGGQHYSTTTTIIYETSGNTTQRTYSPFWRTSAGTMYLNTRSDAAFLGISTMHVLEIAI